MPSQISDAVIWDRFPGGEVLYLPFNFFEGSNNETMIRQQKEMRGNG